MTEPLEIPKGIAIKIIQDIIAQVKNGKFQMELQYRVGKRLGTDKPVLDELTASLVKQEELLIAYQDELEKIQKIESLQE